MANKNLAISARDEHSQRIAEKLTRELGPLIMGLLADDEVIEIMLNEDGTLWEERLGCKMRQVGVMPSTKAEVLMMTVASSLKTNITAENPILECELPLDGSRFEALIPPCARAPVFTIRKKALKVFTLNDYVQAGIMTSPQMAMLQDAVRKRKNILVSGSTGSGKTTLSNAIIHEISEAAPDDRIVVIEDTGELQCAAQNVVTLRTSADVSMTRLLKATMRLRPDRIVVGEVRDGAALDLLKAWNTGHPGGVATVHANSASSSLIRMEQLIAESVPTPMPFLIGEAIDLVVFIEKTNSGRRLREVLSVTGFDGQSYQTVPIEE